ncbi:MAG TPA: hypothetical protein VNU44_05560 [Bryobacteraceae bacterium]|jgi:hypothetical protein|nr:hypothetical protein [Bryobacteraceae bacterium]
MNMDAVIGCDSVDAGAEWLRLRTASGAMRTIPWSAIKIAGLGGNHEGTVEIQGVTEKVTPFFVTHDSLWIVYAEGGVAQVMLDKGSPKRDAILATFAEQLRIGWRGDELTSSELTDALFQMPVSSPTRLPKMLIFMIAGMLFAVLATIVVLVLGRSH